MDVHAPHEPIHGVKDFLLHLLTITVGLLIAVGIEGCVELHHEHSLVKEARVTLREEIEHNAKSMDDAVKKLDANEAAIGDDIDLMTQTMRNPKDKVLQSKNVRANYEIQGLNQTAWKTAQTTGALVYMPHDEAERYTNVYESQQSFLEQQDKILEDEARFMGIVRKIDMGHGDTTPAQAGEILERLGIWQAHLSYLDLMAKVTQLTDHAFLDGKEAPHEMHADLK